MFDWLFAKKKAAPQVPEFLCSAWYQVRPTSELRALPWWNSGAGASFMSNRCRLCFPTSLEETVDRVASSHRSASARSSSSSRTCLRVIPWASAANASCKVAPPRTCGGTRRR